MRYKSGTYISIYSIRKLWNSGYYSPALADISSIRSMEARP